MTALQRHPRHWLPGQLYRAPDGVGDWSVGEWAGQAVFDGPTVVFMEGLKFYRAESGLLHLANYSLGIRLVAWADDPELRKLELV